MSVQWDEAGASTGPNASQQEGEALPTESPLGPQAAAPPTPPTPPQGTAPQQQPQQPTPPGAPQMPQIPAQGSPFTPARSAAPNDWRQLLSMWASHPDANWQLRYLAEIEDRGPA